jgi:hypothetical protein
MRTFCLLLILANAFFLIWSQLIDVKRSPLDRAPVTATPPARIVLAEELVRMRQEEQSSSRAVREVEPPRVAPVETPAPQATRRDSLACTSVGPFSDLPQTAQAQAALRAAGFDSRQRLEQGELWVGYWVSVQGLKSAEAADQAIRTLTDNGVTDVYLMPDSGAGRIVSLGVFSDYQRAQRRADEVSALGLDARISDRKRAGAVYWIDVELQEPGQMLDSSIFQSDETRIMRLEMRACPEEASGG